MDISYRSPRAIAQSINLFSALPKAGRRKSLGNHTYALWTQTSCNKLPLFGFLIDWLLSSLFILIHLPLRSTAVIF